MAKRIVVAFLFFLCAFGEALAIECLGLPDVAVRGVWSWQRVDGRTCWYLGDKATPANQLRWPDSPEQPRKLAGPPPGGKIQCQEQVDTSKSGRWHWRTIDNRQCWFVGDRETPREWLQWPPRKFVESLRDPESVAANDDLPSSEPGEAVAVAVAPGWRIVNPESNADVEFLARDAWLMLLSIDFNVGAEYFTSLPVSYWPVLAESKPKPERPVASPQRQSSLGY